MDIYFDTCALNRLTDDLSQPRILREAEAEAVARVIERVSLKQIRWVASTAVRDEIGHNPNPLRRIAALELLSIADELVAPSPQTLLLATELAQHGLLGIDAVHLATAQQVRADALLTTDDRFIRRAGQGIPNITTTVLNPVDWWIRRQIWLLSHS